MNLARLVTLAMLAVTTHAIYFRDCLGSHPPSGLKWQPQDVHASYDRDSGQLRLSVTGQVDGAELFDLNVTENKYTTLNIQARSFKGQFLNNYTRFCETTSTNGGMMACPIPAGGDASFTYIVEVPDEAPEVSDIVTQFKIITPINQGDGQVVGCVSIQTSPEIAMSTIYAIIFSTFGVSLILFIATLGVQSFTSWTELNSNTDTDTNNSSPHKIMAASLVAQFTGLMSYWQFAFLAACLNLNYAGTYQALASGLAWASLMFGKSFTSSSVMQGPQDQANGIYDFQEPGISAMATIVGLHDDSDIWPGFIIWFLVIWGATLLSRILWHCVAGRRSWSFVVAGLAKATITVTYSLLALPLLAFSFYQLQASNTLNVSRVLSGIIIGFWFLGAVFFCWTVAQGKGDLGCLTGSIRPSCSPTFRASVLAMEMIHVFLLGVCIGVLQNSGVAQVAFMASLEFLLFSATLVVAPYVFSRLRAVVCFFRMIISFLSILFIRNLDTSLSVRLIVGIVILVLHLLACLCILFFAAVIIFDRFRRQTTSFSGTDTVSYHSKTPPSREVNTALLEPSQFNDDLNSHPEKRGSRPETIRLRERPISDYEKRTSSMHERRSSATSTTLHSLHIPTRTSLTVDTTNLSLPTNTQPSPVLKTPKVADRVGAAPQTYYRQPRRRSEDVFAAPPTTPSEVTPALRSPSVDYTQREADIYKRSSTMCDDYELTATSSEIMTKSNSNLVTKTRSADEMSSGVPKHERKLFRPKTWIKPEEDPLEPKGFEVIRQR